MEPKPTYKTLTTNTDAAPRRAARSDATNDTLFQNETDL